MINSIAVKDIGYQLARNSVNKNSDFKTNLRFKAWVNTFTNNKKF